MIDSNSTTAREVLSENPESEKLVNFLNALVLASEYTPAQFLAATIIVCQDAQEAMDNPMRIVHDLERKIMKEACSMFEKRAVK